MSAVPATTVETAAVVPRTTTSEVHRYKANATDKRSQPRLTPEGQ